VDGVKRAEFIAADGRTRELLKPLTAGKDIKRWRVSSRDKWLIYATWDFKLDEYPVIETHLGRFKPLLKNRPEVKEGRYNWWCLRRYGSEYVDEFAKPKIVYPVIVDRSTFALDNSQSFLNDKAFLIGSSELFLLGVLNSSLFWHFLQSICSPLQGSFYEMRRTSLEGCPIPNASDTEKVIISELVQKCLNAKGIGCEPWEREINERVAALYGVDFGDVNQV